jgi:hypothetical protein
MVEPAEKQYPLDNRFFNSLCERARRTASECEHKAVLWCHGVPVNTWLLKWLINIWKDISVRSAVHRRNVSALRTGACTPATWTRDAHARIGSSALGCHLADNLGFAQGPFRSASPISTSFNEFLPLMMMTAPTQWGCGFL